MSASARNLVAVVGAGPAGLFAARELACQGVHVVLFNRDIKPGGLAEYGIFPEKLKIKRGLRQQFHQILALEDVDYYGFVSVGEQGDLNLADLRHMGFQAILVTVGAQGTKHLGIPGENICGVYHAKDLVYHYNRLPPYAQMPFTIGERAAVVGVGNVMLDITHYLATLPQVEEVTAVARRGPGEVKFDRHDLEEVVGYLDMAALEAELERTTPLMRALGQDPADVRAMVQTAREKTGQISTRPHFTVTFLSSPVNIHTDDQGHVNGLEVEDNTLVIQQGEVKARSLGTRHILNVDTVIFAIGDRVDDHFGLPVNDVEFVKAPAPRFPVDGNSYEVFDPRSSRIIADVFVAGWARKASSGLVGIARRDGVHGAQAVLQYLQTLPPRSGFSLEPMLHRLKAVGHAVIDREALLQLEVAERQRARELGLEDFKFPSNQEMLSAVGLLPDSAEEFLRVLSE